jgi:hypothetical protein
MTMAKQVLILQVTYDDGLFAGRPPDMIHAVREGLTHQYGPLVKADIQVSPQYDSCLDPNWVKVRDQ